MLEWFRGQLESDGQTYSDISLHGASVRCGMVKQHNIMHCHNLSESSSIDGLNAA